MSIISMTCLSVAGCLFFVSIGCAVAEKGTDQVFVKLDGWKGATDSMQASKDYSAAQASLNAWIIYKEGQLDVAKGDPFTQVKLDDIPPPVEKQCTDIVNKQPPRGPIEDAIKAVFEYLFGKVNDSRGNQVAAFKALYENAKWPVKTIPAAGPQGAK